MGSWDHEVEFRVLRMGAKRRLWREVADMLESEGVGTSTTRFLVGGPAQTLVDVDTLVDAYGLWRRLGSEWLIAEVTFTKTAQRLTITRGVVFVTFRRQWRGEQRRWHALLRRVLLHRVTWSSLAVGAAYAGLVLN